MGYDDQNFVSMYNDYQKRYADKMRESDKVMLGLIATHGTGSSLLDIGCSTGNLLLHIKRAFPSLSLTGGDFTDASLDQARANPDLAGVEFKHMDIRDIQGRYDMITANAVAFFLDWPDYERAIKSIAAALTPGGRYFAWEFLTPHNQDLQITERCVSHPDGLTFWFRPYRRVMRILDAAGFEDIEFHPFAMPLDLPEPADKEGDTISYTKQLDTGERLSMRGALSQPWCHLTARKRQ